MNLVVLLGRLTADPELRYTPGGHAVASFRLAVDRWKKDEGGEKQADFIPIVCWNELADRVSQYLTKGQQALVQGRMQVRSYEPSGGGKRVYVTEVVATTVQFLSKPKGNGNGEGQGQPEQQGQDGGPEDGDVPF